MTSITGEYHTTRRPTFTVRLRHGLTTTLALAALLGVYVGVQLYDDNRALREQINVYKSAAPRAGNISKCFLQMKRIGA